MQSFLSVFSLLQFYCDFSDTKILNFMPIPTVFNPTLSRVIYNIHSSD